MSLTLYAHPFSSYCQKVLIALYENETPHTVRLLGADAQINREFEALWPVKLMPILVDGDVHSPSSERRTVAESSIIIEYLGLHHAGHVRLIPLDPKEALEVRFMDRFFDNHVMKPMQDIVSQHMRPLGNRDAQAIANSHAKLEPAYRWLDERLADGRQWAAGGGFSLADCAAAPALFYADWTHPIDEAFGHLLAYRRRLLARPSFSRAVDEARPYRGFFPPGAPNRD